MEEALQGIELLMAVKKISLEIDRVVDWGGAQAELTPAQGFLLVYIWNYHRQGTSVTDIHKELGISKATVSGLIKKLRKKGYLSVEEVPDDDRQKKIVATRKLQSEAQYLTERMRQISRWAFGDMYPEERDGLRRMLGQVLRRMKYYKEGSDNDNDFETDPAV